MNPTGQPDDESAAANISRRIRELGDWRGETLAQVRRLIHEADPAIREEWKWRGVPVWSHDGIVCTGETYEQVVKLTFARGAALADPKPLFNSSLEGNVRRAIDIREGEAIDEGAFKRLVRAAVAANTAALAGRKAKRFKQRWATMSDAPALRTLIALAIDALQAGFLSPEQIGASRAFMGLDTQLVEDGTYLVVERDGRIVGCGGWSKRATLYGGDHSTALRDPKLLDPSWQPAKIRAMYTHPEFIRQGIGRLILTTCEQAAAAAGFREAELMATLSGQPLYIACGYEPVEAIETTVGDIAVPLVLMRKPLRHQSASGG